MIKPQLDKISQSAGVYLYQKNQEIIYVGKAKNLKKRISQYFQKRITDPKTKALVAEIEQIKTIKTDSELDALFLESELIKRYKPKYNILLRDDKSQIYIKISNDDLPIISYTRAPLDDGADYFGPFYNAYPIKQAMRYLRWIFPYFIKQTYSRLDAHIGLEPKITTAIDRQHYLHDIKKIKLYIKGEKQQLINQLEKQMLLSAQNQQFELANQYKKQLLALKSLQNKVRLRDNIVYDDDSLLKLQHLFKMKDPPLRIEGYDISHMSGTNVVASMVVFENGVSKRSEYRKFKTKIDQNNDFANMQEILKRRAQKTWQKPDLILIDGGKGQLGAAIDGLSDTDLNDVPIFGLAKRLETIVIHQKSNIKLSFQDEFFEINLGLNDPVTKLLQRIRDEAHRFAVGYHSILKTKQQTISQLDNIKGIGPKTRQKLQRKYGNITKLKKINLAELAQLIGESKAKIIKQALK